jgi:hypothetical protein
MFNVNAFFNEVPFLSDTLNRYLKPLGGSDAKLKSVGRYIIYGTVQE